MKRLLIVFGILCYFGIINVAKSQTLLSFEKVATFSVNEIDSLLTAFTGGSTPITFASSPVDYYIVSYLTPYKHIDSMKIATGAVIVATDNDCPLPMIAYGHGTLSHKSGAPSIKIAQSESLIGIIMASRGYMVGLPDYLSLGRGDSLLIHPYITKFHQGHTTVNMVRSMNQLADSIGEPLSSQLFLSGYSQGGFSAVATHRLIEEEFPQEFNLTASAPGSGPYDLIGAQRELILLDSVYSAPMYLPYIVLAYQSVYENIYDSVQQFFKSPYDSLMPALFYDGDVSSGFIDGVAAPIPNDMIEDTTLANFKNDPNHPLRLALADNDMIDWTPQNPIKLLYCRGDQQVTYLNSELAYDTWTNNGATGIEKADLGEQGHVDCAVPALLSTLAYFGSFVEDCTVGIKNNQAGALAVFPNPVVDQVSIQFTEMPEPGTQISLQNITGQILIRQQVTEMTTTINLSHLPAGTYIIETIGPAGYQSNKLIKE